MVHDQRSALSSYVSALLSAGRTVFTAEEAEQALGVGRGAFLDAAERLQRRKALLNLRQGFYVVVPPQYASWGAPPPAWYIDALMRHERQAYYVGLLKGAELHGATHQAVMEFQVLTATLTALDLLRYPQASGGIDNIATVLSDLGPKIDPEQLAALSATVERPVAQRLGHLLDRLGHEALTRPMLEALHARGSLPWTELDRQEARDPDFAPEPQERDSRWRVIVRRVPELDE